MLWHISYHDSSRQGQVELGMGGGLAPKTNTALMRYHCIIATSPTYHTVILSHRSQVDSDMPDKSTAAVQCALLYTTANGERRIRVHTISLAVSSSIGELSVDLQRRL